MIPDQNLAASLLSGLATGLGGLLAVVAGRAGAGIIPAFMGLSSGIGFTVIFFDLLPEAIKAGSWAATAAGTAVGLAFGKAAGAVFPHLHPPRPHRACRPAPGRGAGNLMRTGYLFALGVAMHNLPEGLAVGAGLEAGPELGILLAAAIGLHNVPEGMALCGVIILAGASPIRSLAVAAGAGMMLPLGTALAGVWMAAVPGMFSFILALGAGAMLYVIASELVPESFRMHPGQARTGMAAGGAVSLAISLLI